MGFRMRDVYADNPWASFADLALSLLLVFLFFLLLQFIANSKALERMQLERRQKTIVEAFEQRLPREWADREIEVGVDGNLQTFRFSNHILFASGEADLQPRGVAVLTTVADILKGHRFASDTGRELYTRVQLRGHTDDTPVGPSLQKRYPTNWQLSSARAMSVVELFVELDLDPRMLSATGFGEYQPVRPNTTPEGRDANRRIDMVLVYSEAVALRSLAGAVP